MNTPYFPPVAVWLLGQEEPQRLIERLSPTARAQVLLLLLFVIVLGAGLVLFTWLWGRTTRRVIRDDPHSRRPPRDEDDWASKPLVRPDDPQSSDSDSAP